MTQEQQASTEPVSVVEPVSTTGETTQQVVTTPEPSAEEKMAALVSKMIAEEVSKLTAASKREIQSAKDKATAEVSAALRRARLAESTLGATRTHLQTLDPEVAKEMELAELRAKERSRGEMEREDALQQQSQAFHDKFISGLTNYMVSLGIDPNDQRIQVVGDNLDYIEIQRQVLDSVSKIQKENVKAMETSLDIKIKESEKRIKRELGGEDVNSVSTTVSGGVVAGSDAEFIKKFGMGELPSTKVNVDRYNKIVKSY